MSEGPEGSVIRLTADIVAAMLRRNAVCRRRGAQSLHDSDNARTLY